MSIAQGHYGSATQDPPAWGHSSRNVKYRDMFPNTEAIKTVSLSARGCGRISDGRTVALLPPTYTSTVKREGY